MKKITTIAKDSLQIELLFDAVSKKATSGVGTLVGRTALLQVVTVISTFLLSVYLPPSVFGMFFLVSGIVAFLNYFSDIGLAAALVQKKEAPSDSDLQTTFTIQQILVIFLVIVSLAFSSHIALWRNLPQDGLWLLQTLIVSFFFSSLKTIPSILLERELNFHKLVIPQIVETMIFYVSAVIFAFLGWGISSLTIAVFLRGISGLVAMYLVSPWKPSFGIEVQAARKLLSFGIPFQINSLLALVKDDLFTVVVLGTLLSFTEVGFVGWAKKWGELPLRLIMDNVIRVTFPAYSRLQHHSQILARAVERALFYLTVLVIPLVTVMVFGLKPLLHLVTIFVPGYYDKWQAAILSFYFFTLASIFSAISTPLVNALNAIGKVKVTLYFMIFWTIVTWTIIPLLILVLGFQGIALGMFFLSATGVFSIYVAKRYIPFSLSRAFVKPLCVSATVVGFMWIVSGRVTAYSPLIQLASYAAALLLAFSSGTFIFARSEFVTAVRKLRHD